jgi:hypothetical protein
LGLCSDSGPNAPLACLLGSGACADGLGICEDFERACTNATSCDPSAYAAPAVEIGPTSSNATTIEQSMANHLPQGLTPIAPALQGALDHAREWGALHADHEVAVLLVTDGLVTACGADEGSAPAPSSGLDDVLAILAASGEAPIQTFVMGVRVPADQTSVDNINAIARAGGTDSGLLIDPSGDVEQQFLTHLRTVRDREAACRMELTSARAVDFRRAEVSFDSGTGALERPPQLGGPADCAATPEGWYYDVPLDQGTPRFIELCPSLCRSVRASPAAELSIEIACAGSE